MAESAPRIPAHLRRFVVEQDYWQYNAADQAVGVSSCKQTHARLVETAHPAYWDGLAATGIAINGIPSVQETNDSRGPQEEVGWATLERRR